MSSRRGQEGSHHVGGSGSVASDAPFQVPRGSISGSAAPGEMDVMEPPKGWYNVGCKELLDTLVRWERRRSAQVPYAGYDGSMINDGQQLTTPYLLTRWCWPNAERLVDIQSSPACTAPAFAPVTPDKQVGSREGRHQGNAGLSDGGETSREGQHQASVCSTVNPEEKYAPIWFNFNQKATNRTYISSTDIPMPLEENCQEKAEEGVDLNKTPTQKPRRKKHRPKVVTEGKRSRTPKPSTSKPMTSKPAETAGSAGGKRKHVRRQGINSPVEHHPDVIGGESTEIYANRTRSVRRRLDFSDKASEIRCQAMNCMEQAKVMSTQKTNCQPSSDNGTCSSTWTTSAPKGKHEAGINYSSSCLSLALSVSNSQILDGYLNSLDIPSLPLQPSRRELIRENLKKLARLRDIRQVPGHESTTWSGKTGCQSVLGNAPTPTSTAKMMSRNENVRTGQNMESNNLSYSAMLHGVNAIREHFKYEHNLNPSKPNGSSVSLIDANQSPPFPRAPKKRRTQKRQNGVALSEVVSTADAHRILESARLQYMEGKQACSQREKRRSNVPSQSCNVTPTDHIRNDHLPGGSETLQPINEGLNNGSVYEPQACVQALMTDALAKVARKRRTRKEKTRGLDITGYQDTGGLYIDITSSNQEDIVIDILAKKLEHLDIKTDKEIKVQESYAIVPYGTHGMIVSFSGQLDPRKKFRPRAKVDLDQETSRVWKLLMGKESLDRIEGTGVDKEKWWEEERQVFRGRADSFIAKMHLVQGDRRFSPWKGSVLDSVIGVFLTQNVSDHLSSSAFMALAARFPHDSKKKFSIDLNSSACVDLAAQFPHDSKKKCKETNCDEVSMLMRKPAVCMVDLNGSDPPACVYPQVAAQAVSEMEEKEKHPSWKNIKESKSDSVGLAITNSFILGSSFSHLELLEIAGSPMFRELYAVRTTNPEIESSNLPFGNVLEHGLPVTEEGPLLSSVFSDQFASLGTKDHLSEEHPCQVYEHGNSLLAPQRVSSRNSQEVTVNHGQHLTGVITNTCYGLQDERTMEIKRKLRCSDLCSRSYQIDSEVLHETKTCTHEGHSSSYLTGTSGIAACIEMEKEKHVADNNNKENPKQGSFSSIKHPVASSEPRTRRAKSEKDKTYDWESLRREVSQSGAENERSPDTMDSLDWEEVRNADVNEISNTIRERGMNNMLAERIKSFLDRLVKDHGSTNLEWLRDIPPDKAKDYLLSIRGLGLKSVECVRLLTLHHLAFPVDTNVGRICVRLGWVPLQPLPESLQLHLLELYPMLETIQKYLWPRLCTLDQRTLYELHYQMITFGKVFCTKSKPNCNACPMRGECKHFASAFASARLALPGPEDKSLVNTTMDSHKIVTSSLPPLRIEGNPSLTQVHVQSNLQPIIEEPSTPELECTPFLDVPDIEECFYEDADEIPTIKLNAMEFAQNLQNYMQDNNMELQNVDWSKALVALTPEAASIPMPKLKNVNRLRTEHRVYELPDSHPLLEGLDKREPQDPCPYLLAIWTPGETAESIEPPESCSNVQEAGSLCDKATCFACNSLREAQAQMVRGTILIPCRTAMRGSFPLNGTYFQVNEVFADHESSLTPIDVPRVLIWNLPRRIVYFGTSVPAIFRGLAIEDIQNCFWRGFVCVRGFDRNTRRPRPLMARLHFPVSKLNRGKKAGVKDVE